MAKSCGYIITVEDFSDLSKIIPLICKIYPNGEADVNQFHSDGGIARMLANLLEADLIFEDIQTVIGTGLNAYTQVPCLKDDEFGKIKTLNRLALKSLLNQMIHSNQMAVLNL